MRIAILNITAGGISGGYIKYLINLVPRISSNPSVEKIICTLPPAGSLNIISESCPNIEFVNIASYRINNLGSFSGLKLELDKFKPDVVYVPVERPFSYAKAPVVNMLQNMEPFICPFSKNPPIEKVKNWLRLINARNALRKADRIIAISKYVENYLINELAVNANKIGLVYHGHEKPNISPAKPQCIPEHLNNFLFTAGSIRPARGLEDALEALHYLKTQNLKIPLVIAGNVEPVMTGYHKKLCKWIDKNNLSADVIWAGHLNESEMKWCYENCTSFIMTSRVESFGLIALEAMSYGCCCISANNPCLPEIFNDSAVYYNPENGKDLSALIKDVLSWSLSKKKQASQQAIRRSFEFSWDVCAEKTLSELKLAIEHFD